MKIDEVETAYERATTRSGSLIEQQAAAKAVMDNVPALLAIARVAQSDRWVPVAERLPGPPPVPDEYYGSDYSDPVIVRFGDTVVHVLLQYSLGQRGWVESGMRDGPNPSDYEFEGVTHWRPLPALTRTAAR